MIRIRQLGWLSLLQVLLILGACKKPATKETASPYPVTRDQGSVTIPATFPPDVPVPSGLVNAAMALPNGHTVTIASPVTMTQAVQDLRARFKEEGWSESTSTTAHHASMISFTKPADGQAIRTCQCSLSRGNDSLKGKTIINMNIPSS